MREFQNESQREGRTFSFLHVFSFLMPLLEVIKIVIASVASVVFLGFACITLTGSAVALAVSTPIFVIFSPVLVPATIATVVLTTGFTAGGSFVATALSLVIWLIKVSMGVKPSSSQTLARVPKMRGKLLKSGGLRGKLGKGGLSKLGGGGLKGKLGGGGLKDKIGGALKDKLGGGGLKDKLGGGGGVSKVKEGISKLKEKLGGGMSSGGGDTSGGEGGGMSGGGGISKVKETISKLKEKLGGLGGGGGDSSGGEGGMSGSEEGMSGSEGDKSGSEEGKSGSE